MGVVSIAHLESNPAEGEGVQGLCSLLGCMDSSGGSWLACVLGEIRSWRQDGHQAAAHATEDTGWHILELLLAQQHIDQHHDDVCRDLLLSAGDMNCTDLQMTRNTANLQV